jgi:hypothetical protein
LRDSASLASRIRFPTGTTPPRKHNATAQAVEGNLGGFCVCQRAKRLARKSAKKNSSPHKVFDAKTILNEFYNLSVEARCDFDPYRSLFEQDVKKIELCINFAPFFFNDIDRIIVRGLVLQICKLTDPAGSGSKINLTTNYILQKLPWPTDVKQQLTEFNDLLMKFRAKN